MLTKHFHGKEGWETRAKMWIEHNQRLLGEHTILRVFGETGDWSGHQMFGSEPKDEGIWNLDELRDLAKRGIRIRRLTPLNRKVIDWLCRMSHETGIAFEYVVDATLKHTEGLVTGTTDHAIRQTALYFRELIDGKDAPYPNATIVFEARNEWNAHNKTKTKINQVNMWAQRMYRWAKGDDRKVQFRSPGDDWVPEQWPEGHIIVDKSTGNGANVGPEPGNFKMSLEHPDRDRPQWWTLPPTFEQLVTDARGVPFGYNESILYCDEEDWTRVRSWYGARGWTTDLDHYLMWLDNCKDSVRYFIIHDEKGMQCDTHWPRGATRLETELGDYPPPPPPPPPRVSYAKVVRMAYLDILGRLPDPGGLDFYDRALEAGMTEAEMRERMMRSEEFKKKN
jgi:hypothetical protein